MLGVGVRTISSALEATEGSICWVWARLYKTIAKCSLKQFRQSRLRDVLVVEKAQNSHDADALKHAKKVLQFGSERGREGAVHAKDEHSHREEIPQEDQQIVRIHDDVAHECYDNAAERDERLSPSCPHLQNVTKMHGGNDDCVQMALTSRRSWLRLNLSMRLPRANRDITDRKAMA